MAIAISITATAWWVSFQFEHTVKEEHQQIIKSTVALAKAESALWQLRYGFGQFIVGDAEARQRILAEEPQAYAIIESNLDAYARAVPPGPETRALAELRAEYLRYKEARPKFFELYGAGRIEDAVAWRALTTTPHGAATVKAFERQIDLQRTLVEQRTRQEFELLDRNRLILTILSGLLLGLLGLGYWAALRPIRALQAQAQRVVREQLGETIEVSANGNEVAALVESFEVMTAAFASRTSALERVDAALRQQQESLAQTVAERTAELSQANFSLRDNAARLQSILDTVADGIITIDQRGSVETLNPAAERIFGYAAAEVIGQNVKMLMPEPYHGQHDGYLEHYRATGEARVIGIGREVVGRRRDGNTFPLELAVSAMQIGNERHFTGIVRDITARRQAELQTAGSVKELADFKAALDEHAIVATTDAQGTITYVNDKFCAISKYAREELIGQNHRIVNSGHHPTEFFNELWQTIASGGIWKGEIRNRARDGTFYWVNTTIVPFLDEHLKPVQYIAIRGDITKRKEAEQALVAARNAAQQANSAKDSFLATMSHEIRTPLGGLMGMLELLSLSPLDPEQGETLQTARDSGRSLLRILNDILDWSKIEEGKLELAPQTVSIAGLVAEVANTYSHVASGNSVTLSGDVDPRLAPAHLVDPLRLSQVLNNFVSNAIKFSHGGRVELRAELIARDEDAEQVRFSVRDTGIGIAPEVQQRLFRNYGQASADTARMYGGTGLGLAICRRLADLMDGRLDLESMPGRGSTFSITLTLPIAQAVLGAGQGLAAIDTDMAGFAPPLVAGVATAGAPRVLVVDDHPTNRKLLVRQLALLGLPAETAENGKLALALWRTGRYALVITDCHMPVLDGYALARAIRGIEAAQARPHTPIFAWTANALADEIENCHRAGMDELLVKPTDLVQLKAMLAKWLPTSQPAPSVAGVGAAGAAIPRRRQELAAGAAPTILPANQAPPAGALDVRVLAALIGDDPAILREFLLDFAASAKTIAAELLAACAGGDATQAGALAHKLKSSARAVGALPLGDLCAAIEAAGKAGQTAMLSELAQQFKTEMAVADAALGHLTTWNAIQE